MSISEVRSSNGGYSQEMTIDHVLIPDVLRVIFGNFATLAEVNAARSVSHAWYKAVLLTVQQGQSLGFLCFNDLLQAPILSKASTEVSNCKDFSEVQALSIRTRDKIVDLLKPLSEDELMTLESDGRDVLKPLFFFRVFELTKICKAIEGADEQGEVLESCVESLAAMHFFEKGIEVARSINDIYYKQVAFFDLTIVLGANGQLERATKIAIEEMVPGNKITEKAIRLTSEKLTEAGRIEEVNDGVWRY